MINRVLGENIRALREIAGFTQSNLAQFLNVDQSLISEVEREKGVCLLICLGSWQFYSVLP